MHIRYARSVSLKSRDGEFNVAEVDLAIAEVRTVFLILIRSIVDSPNAVEIEPRTAANGVVMCLSVAPIDIGKVIGKQGRTARSLRVLLHAALRMVCT